MRKLIIFLMIITGMLVYSCNSIDSKIGKLEKACKAGDLVKASKIANDLESQKDKITDEQAIKIVEASMKCSEASMNQLKDFDIDED